MIRHFLTFAHQADVLHRELVGWHLAECWSAERNTLALRFIRGIESRHVDVSLDPHAGHILLRDDLARPRKNTLDFFGDLVGKKLDAVAIDDGERVVRFRFVGGDALVLLLFGAGGGNVCHVREGGVVDSLRRYDGEHDALLRGSTEGIGHDFGRIVAAIRTPSATTERSLARALPELGRRLAIEAACCASLDPNGDPTILTDADIRRLLTEADRLYSACQLSNEYHVYHLDRDAIFSLVPLQSLEATAVHHERFLDIAQAVRAWRSAHFGRKRQGELRDTLIRRVDHEIGRLEKALTHRLNASAHRERADEWEHMGNVLLAHLHEIAPGGQTVQCVDWNGTMVVVPLNPLLSVPENAERLFRRARGARAQAERAERGVEKTEAALTRMRELRGVLAETTSLHELERIIRRYPRLVMKEGEQKPMGSPDRYRRFRVAGELDVYAGKSAANNDELTMRFAKPNDYWFHARGSSGSHVVLRWNDAKTKPPREAIRAAASIAAYYSGARNAKSVPVAYTQKKYVRKPRGSAPGSVVMEREQVVMAEPKLPASDEQDD